LPNRNLRTRKHFWQEHHHYRWRYGF